MTPHPNQALHSVVREWIHAKSMNDENENDWQQFYDIRRVEQFDTSMSTNVSSKVLFQAIDLVPADSTIVLDQNGLLNWNEITRYKLTNTHDIEEDGISFEKASNPIKRLAVCVHDIIFNLSQQEFGQKYDASFVLAEPKVMEWTFDAYKQGHALFAFTLIVPYLERALQDALYNHLKLIEKITDEKRLKHMIPTKLNDLFVVPRMETIFGSDILFLCRALIGPLNGLNLRNVTVHGFVAPHEFNPSYTALMLVLVASISKFIQSKFGTDYQIRPLRVLSENFSYLDEIVLDKQSLVRMVQDEHSKWDSLLDHSLFSLSPWKSMWKYAIQLYIDGFLYQSLVALFPLIEHAIRRIFVCANQENDHDVSLINQFMTADSNVLYTTLDILLSNTVATSIATTTVKWNSVFDQLGPQLGNIVFDTLIWSGSEDLDLKSTYECPRIRDHVSHGNIDPNTLSPIIADRVMVLSLGLIAHFDIRKNREVHWPAAVSRSYLHICEEYDPLFHPKSLLLSEIKQICTVLNNLQPTLEQSTASDYPEKEVVERLEQFLSDTICAFCTKTNEQYYLPVDITQKIFKDGQLDHKIIPDLITKLQIYRVDCTEKELTKILIARKIANHILQIEKSLSDSYKELKEKVETRTAWKRDRKAFELLTNYSTCYTLALLFLLLMIEHELHMSHVEENNTEFIHKCWKLSGSISAAFRAGRLQSVFEMLHAFCIGKDYKYKTLSNKESVRLFCDVQVYLAQ
jgi:hypothetical protein